jgi:hypothetical protein
MTVADKTEVSAKPGNIPDLKVDVAPARPKNLYRSTLKR